MLAGGEELVSETVITDVYKDPLELCMDGIEEMARKILRTGRLAITGEPGGMYVRMLVCMVIAKDCSEAMHAWTSE